MKIKNVVRLNVLQKLQKFINFNSTPIHTCKYYNNIIILYNAYTQYIYNTLTLLRRNRMVSEKYSICVKFPYL